MKLLFFFPSSFYFNLQEFFFSCSPAGTGADWFNLSKILQTLFSLLW